MSTKRSIFINILIISASMLALCSCHKGAGWLSPGDPVRFTAGSGGADTKAAYSGQKNSDGTIERIDWQVGDVIRIYCAQVSEPSDKFADYKVASVSTPATGSAVSTARIELSGDAPGGIGLRWGEGNHTFYAVFPRPSTDVAAKSISANVVTASIPASQNVVGSISKTGSNWKAVPDLKNMVMTAKAGPFTVNSFPEEDDVFLSFKALTTAIEFTIKNGTGADLDLTEVQLISGNGKTSAEPVISGAFSVDLDKQGIAAGTQVKPFTGNDFTIEYIYDYPLCSSSAATSTSQAADRTISIKVGTDTAPLTLAEDETFTFTFFLNPVHDFNDLSFKLVKADNSWMSTRLGYTDGDGIFFPRHKKSSVTGLLIPDGAKWTVNYGPSVEKWGADGSGIDPMPLVDEGLTFVSSWKEGVGQDLTLLPLKYAFTLDNEGNAALVFTNTTGSMTKTIDLTSELEKDDGSAEYADWVIKSVKVGSGAAETVGATSFSGIEGLSAEKVNDGKSLKVTSAVRSSIDVGTHDYWTNASGRTEGLGWSPEHWTAATASNPIDLSRFDFRTETQTSSMTTANCYVIRHAGTYRIPLVYGNGIVNGVVNEQAYKPTMASGGKSDYFLSTFQNHLGRSISSPFIENNKTSNTGSNYIKAQAASIVWQDQAEVIKNVQIVNGASSGTAGNYNTSNVRYLQFTVDSTTICQNNAIIAIKDGTGSDASIIWSWHIWTTNDPALLEEPIAVTNATSQVYKFFPLYNLGWIDANTYPSRDDVIITLSQEGSNKEIEIKIKQASILAQKSNGVWYQWGRKDPLCSVDNPARGTYNKSSNNVSLATSIKNPGMMYYGSIDSWCNANYYNLWSGKLCITGKFDKTGDIIKTIYDPSPAGYMVPASNAFTGITTPGGDVSTLYMPVTKMRRSSDGTVYGGSTGAFWSVNPSSTNNGYCLVFNVSEATISNPTHYSITNGFSVRPVKEN